jgi:hypothetical protein
VARRVGECVGDGRDVCVLVVDESCAITVTDERWCPM